VLYSLSADPNEVDKITTDGTVRLLGDLGLSPDSRLVLIMVWKMRAATQCEFSREEFTGGLMELGVDSVDKLRTRLALVEADTLRDPVKFRDLYIFSFAYAKNPSQKGIEIDMAVPYWHILLHGRFTLLELWTQFIQVGNTNIFRNFETGVRKLMVLCLCVRSSTSGRFLVIRGSFCWTFVRRFRRT
jgi:DCN1-like protein 1/2